MDPKASTTERHLTIQRTARYYTLEPAETVREVWMVLHGYGQLAAYFLRPFHSLVGNDRLIVAPEALSRFYLNQASGRVGASWMTREDRLCEIDDYLRYLDAVAEAVREPLEPSVAVHAFGFSQGATAACRWAVLGATPVRRLVLWGGGLPHDLDYEAHASTLSKKDLTFVVGTNDEYLTPERREAQEALLQRYTIPYQLHTYEGGHRLHPETLRAIIDL